jgi:hypothetical protein
MRGFNSDDVLNRAIRGNVQVMKDGNIRWSYVSVYRARDGRRKYLIVYLLLPGCNI